MFIINNIRKSISAGMMIGIGATAHLLCDNKFIAAFLFAAGLFTICMFEMNLFTGKIAYMFEEKEYSNSLVIWIGNFIGCLITSLPIRLAMPEISQKAYLLIENKIQNNIFSTIILSVFCGILMYLAVENYRMSENRVAKIVGLFLNVMVFIICGFEHSVANMCYGIFSISNYNMIIPLSIFIIIVSLANGLGAVLCRKLTK